MLFYFTLAQVTTPQCADWYGSLATCYARLTLRMPAPWPVHSACWFYFILAQVTTPQCADWCGSLATCYARLTLRMPAPWPVHSACWFYFILAQVTTPQCADWCGSLATCYARLKAYFEPPIKIAKWVHFAARTVLVVAASTHRPGAAKVTLACFW